MGWTFMSDPKIGKDELVARLISPTHWGASFKLLRHAVVGNNLWQAIERTMGDGTTHRFIALDLLQPGGRDSGWGHKDLSESMGPCEVNCPLSFFDLVPEPEEEGTYRWRAAVRRHHELRGEARALQKTLAPGSAITMYGKVYRLESPYYGKTGQRIVGWRAVQLNDGKVYRITSSQVLESLAELARTAGAVPEQISLLEAA